VNNCREKAENLVKQIKDFMKFDVFFIISILRGMVHTGFAVYVLGWALRFIGEEERV
jgi:hypothetical protein